MAASGVTSGCRGDQQRVAGPQQLFRQHVLLPMASDTESLHKKLLRIYQRRVPGASLGPASQAIASVASVSGVQWRKAFGGDVAICACGWAELSVCRDS